MKTVFIIITRGSLVMNFFFSGVAKKLLNTGVKLIVLSPFSERKEVFTPFQHENLYIEPLHDSPQTTLSRIMLELLKGAIFNKTIHTRYIHRITAADSPPSKLWYLPRMLFFAPLRLLPGFKNLIRFFDFHLQPQRENDYLFEKYKPDLVFSTTPNGVSDVGVLKGAKRHGVKTIAMPKSWDTLSKFLFNTKTDRLLVWSSFSKEQALRYQGYKDSEVSVTGAPQFDYYAHKEKIMEREEFFKKNGLDPKKRLILYGSTGSNLCYESRYADLIKKYIDEEYLGKAQVLIRPHIAYLGDGEQFKQLNKYPDFVVDKQEKQDSRFKDNWDISEEYLSHLFNSLSHADVCVNVASTLTIDATMCGTPVININFDFPDIKKDMSVKRLYKSDYVDEITSFGATWVVKSEEEYLNALKEVVVEGKRKDEEMKKLIKHFACANDGRAAERIANATLNMLKN
ncbi:MAG: CDP-glycerol glycerophosphotransferase family protein [Candidatus Pacebacteria bacterium]|jgi:hypothetical protein|nr:hypothetical protein [bacterium]MDP6527882.1 CDP-glycerol glycerophosphotransferase family protein [Candidatus Paceibacterota bacterium]MDP6659692.1 CDP-glycerol glycerophosphotransferase family protein [Candidatus Paceibacterota bacterium]|tara:strand:- start:36227 stop:37591 length:1365 start_codon:yes stop_codon:yes gene_type:complete